MKDTMKRKMLDIALALLLVQALIPLPALADESAVGDSPSGEAVAFVGDRIYTDVATGVNNGAKGFLVLTGETKAEDVEKSSVKPDAVFESLGEMKGYL